MELGGDEKRIQALFSELSFEDQSCVPQFGPLWAHASAKKDTGRIFRPVAIFVSLLATCSLGVWTWYQSSTPNIVVELPPPVTFEAPYTPSWETLQPIKLEPRRRKHVAHRREIDRTIATEAALLSSWQSPTQGFMSSPTDLALSSIPQLDQSAKDLESFLSKNNEIMKESNQ